MRYGIAIVVVCTILAGAAPATGQDIYGGASLSGVFAGETSLDETEELDGSAVVLRGHAGSRFDPGGDTTRIQLSSTYFGYVERKDRWSNVLDAEYSLQLSRDVTISIEGSAATNVLTLERRSTDQAGAVTRLRLEPGDHRIVLSGGTRRRWYDDSTARSWAPFLEAEYRYRLGSWHSIAFEGRQEWIDSDLNSLDYKRLSLSAFYTRPLSRDTRLRAGLTHRRWSWDDRFTPARERRHERLWLPQVRLTHEIGPDVELELDARRILRRSNDDRFDRVGTRLAATVRTLF